MRAEAVKQLPEPQIFAGELVDCGATHQLHSSSDLRSHQAKGPLNARLTAGRQRIEIETTDADGFGPERKRLQHMRSALDATIHDHVDPIAHGIHNLSQLIERCARHWHFINTEGYAAVRDFAVVSHYERLVAQPNAFAREVCSAIRLPFEEAGQLASWLARVGS